MSNRRHAGQTKDGKKSKSLSITSKSAWEGLQPLEPRLLLSAIANEAAYDRWICIESSASTDVQATANVLATQLEDMTGSEFNIETTKTTGRGIFLVRAAEDLATRYPDLVSQQSDLDTLETKTTEGFFIYSAAGSGSLYIVGNSDEALSLGAYYYLHQLGWDALLPGEDWTIKPQLSSITVSIDSLQDPAFIQRIFGGSGGMGGPLDPTKQLEADWILWKQENLFGGPATDGHAWQVFAADKKTELEEHPEYAAFDVYIGPDDPGNHHVPWSEDMKFDLSNQGLLDLFAAWAVSKYNPVTYPIVSIEPTDLSDFCVCPDCKANYQYDQDSTPIFHLAQVVADALKTAYPNDNPMINLYAYNTHAAVPYDQDLQDWLADPDSNIWVGVAPNGYQSTNLTADELAAAWAQAKPANLGLYDYIGMTDFSMALPTEDIDADVQKLLYWIDLGYDGLYDESTYSAGAVGQLWYVMGRLMWDPNQDPNDIKQEFCDKAFGPAVVPMQRMMARWGGDFMLTPQEIGRSFQDIAEARALAADDPACLARINEYAKYVQYLRLYCEYLEAYASYSAGDAPRHAAAEALIRHMWQINDSYMVQSYRINLNLCGMEDGDTALQADWNVYDSDAAGWAWVQANPLDDEDVTAIVNDGLADYAMGTGAPYHTVFDQPVYSTEIAAQSADSLLSAALAISSQLTALNPDYTIDTQNPQRTAEMTWLYDDHYFTFYVNSATATQGSITFEIRPGFLNYPETYNTVIVYGPDYDPEDPEDEPVFIDYFGGGGEYGNNDEWATFAVPTTSTGNYTMFVVNSHKSYDIKAERNLPFVLQGNLQYYYELGQKSYFYVPAGVSTAGLYAPSDTVIVVKDSDGNTVDRSFGTGKYESEYTVAVGQDGAIWSMEEYAKARPGASPLNLPRVWSFSPESTYHGMMVPVNAAPSVAIGPDVTIVSPTDEVSLSGLVTDDHMSDSPYASVAWTKQSGPGTVTFDVPAPTQLWNFENDTVDSGAAGWTNVGSGTQTVQQENGNKYLHAYGANYPTGDGAKVDWYNSDPDNLFFGHTIIELDIRFQGTSQSFTPQFLAYDGVDADEIDAYYYSPSERICPDWGADLTTVDVETWYHMRIDVNDDQGKFTVSINGATQQYNLDNDPDNHGGLRSLYFYVLGGAYMGDGPLDIALDNVTVASAAPFDATATFSATGTYVLRLTATDGDSLSAYDEVTVNYLSTAANTPPTVSAGDDETIMLPATASLDGTVTDDGKPNPPAALNYTWTEVRGPGVVYFANPAAVDTTASFDTAGEYLLRLTASDGSLSAYDEVTITVKPDCITGSAYQIGDTGTFGMSENFNYSSWVATLSTLDSQYSARFTAMENITIDRVCQRLMYVPASAYVQVGIMADDGEGNPDGTFLASTASYHPAEDAAWAVFTSSANLTAGQVYHVVTQVTALDGSFLVYGSGDTDIRPYDRAADASFNAMYSADGGETWTVKDQDPYMVLGYGSAIVAGPGQPYASASTIATGGGSYQAVGQKFSISTREVPADGRVTMSDLTMKVSKSGNPTDPLIVEVRDSEGEVLATITKQAANIADTQTQYTWSFDDGAQVQLTPGQAYFITTRFGGSGGTTGQAYYFAATFAASGQGDATWGGTTTCVPILSAAYDSWNNYNWSSPTLWPSWNVSDLWFRFTSVVTAEPRYELNDTAVCGNYETFDYAGSGQTINSMDDLYDARFQAHETVTVDRVYQYLYGVDSATRIEVGIMADDGNGRPDGRYLVSTGSYDPANGSSLAWAVFTQPITLEAGKVYHIVTRPTVLGGSDSFAIYRSSGNQDIRPYDRTIDTYMSALTSTNGGAWTVNDYDPYFVLGDGANIAQGPGQPYQLGSTYLSARGGAGQSCGQKFEISLGELPAYTAVETAGLTMRVCKSGSPTQPFVVKVRLLDGTVLGTITVPAANISTSLTQYAWSFDGEVSVKFNVGQTYLITTQLGETPGSGTTSQYYYMYAPRTSASPDQGAASWGGTTDCVPIISGSSSNWTSWSATSDYADLWFSFSGTVVVDPPQGGEGGMREVAPGDESLAAIPSLRRDRLAAAIQHRADLPVPAAAKAVAALGEMPSVEMVALLDEIELPAPLAPAPAAAPVATARKASAAAIRHNHLSARRPVADGRLSEPDLLDSPLDEVLLGASLKAPSASVSA